MALQGLKRPQILILGVYPYICTLLALEACYRACYVSNSARFLAFFQAFFALLDMFEACYTTFDKNLLLLRFAFEAVFWYVLFVKLF